MAYRSRIAALLWLLLSLLCLPVRAICLTSDEQKLLSSIRGARIKAVVSDLCCDRFAGRKAGSPGQELAASYIADRFASLRLDRVAGSYAQNLTMRMTLVKSTDDIVANLQYQDGAKQVRRSFAYPDYYGRGGIDLKAETIFVGRGGADPASRRDDYGGLNVKGKVVVWMSDAAPDSGQAEASVLSRVVNAYKRGAAASLIVGLRTQIHRECGGFGLAGPIADFPCLSLRPETARALFPGAWDDLVKEKTGRIRSGRTVRINVPAIYNPSQPTRNVLCRLPGRGDTDELVLLGAHYDHLGVCDAGGIFRGADDNASGTAVLMAVAEALTTSGLQPKRSIIFAAWTGEEAGLIGSTYFAKSPPFAMQRLKAALNMDMVGVGTEGSYMTAGKLAYPEQYRVLSASADDLRLTLSPDEAKGVSDHLAFARKGIPSLLVYTAGEHPNYHTVRDRPETVNPAILENTAKLVALTIWRLANR
ncbi:MAG: M20/M25/M40 family metallo-hydrolase [Armatimonadota bacterium]|nr:M20/M25/M40 family metallo-hydrolase [Armatimonadota bacterium]